MAFTMVAIKGTWYDAIASSSYPVTPSSASLTLRLDKPQSDQQGLILPNDPTTIDLASDGTIPAGTLFAANDDPSTMPKWNFYHLVVTLPKGFRYSQTLVIPASAPIDQVTGYPTLDISRAAPAPTTVPQYPYATLEDINTQVSTAVSVIDGGTP